MNTKPLLFAKLFYFFYYAAWACFLPFLSLYYQSLGFSGSQIGLLSSITPLAALFAAPLWGGLADATRRHKKILLGTMLSTALSVLMISQQAAFWVMVPVVAVYAFFSAPIMPLVDHSVVTLLGEKRDNYGSQRVWGAIGWGLTGPLIGWVIGQFGLHVSFYGYLFLAVFAFLAAARLPIHSAARSSPFWTGMRLLLADRRWYPFLLVAFLSGAGLNVVHSFLFLYMKELNASNTVMGLTLAVATVSEIPVLLFSGYMIRRWGTRGLLVISLAAFVLRAYGYALATEPWQVLLLQLTHGLTFSAMFVAGVSFASEMAPPGMGATAQGVFTSTMMGFGGITGSLVGGVLFQNFGGSSLYAWSGTAMLVGLCLFLIVDRRQAVRQDANSSVV